MTQPQHFDANSLNPVNYGRGVFYAVPGLPTQFTKEEAAELAISMSDAARIAKLPRPQHMFYVTELQPSQFVVSMHVSHLNELTTLEGAGFFPVNVRAEVIT